MYFQTKELDEKYTNTNNQIKNDKPKNKYSIVCSYWLKGSCKNGNNCNYLHEDNPDKYPECPHGLNCKTENCNLKHSKRVPKECHAYNAGYCPKGKQCKDSHKEQKICLNYLLGFCPDGPNCKLFHQKTLITNGQDDIVYLAKEPSKIV